MCLLLGRVAYTLVDGRGNGYSGGIGTISEQQKIKSWQKLLKKRNLNLLLLSRL